MTLYVNERRRLSRLSQVPAPAISRRASVRAISKGQEMSDCGVTIESDGRAQREAIQLQPSLRHLRGASSVGYDTPASARSSVLSYGLNIFVFHLVCRLPSLAYAAPTALVKRDGGPSKIIVPVVVICSVFSLLLLYFTTRNGNSRRVGQWMTNAAAAFGPTTGLAASDGPRELTAEQLAASDRRNGAQPATAGSAATTQGTARRARRNRRTPSQISTRSLPAYMKEPGEQELVIYRGPEDLEDMAPTTTNIVMPAVMENPNGSFTELSEPRVYVAMPDSPHDMPLLAGDDSLAGPQLESANNNPQVTQLPSRRSRLSSSTVASSGESRSLEGQLSAPDPRGQAPPYFEVVSLEEMNSPESDSTPAMSPFNSDAHTSPSTSDSHPSHSHRPSSTTDNNRGQTGSRRLSGLFSIFHTRNATTSSRSAPSTEAHLASSSTHRRENSESSIATSASNHARNRAPSRATMHRPSFSGSNSMFSVMTRSRSRLLEQQNLTSPSMISLNSISSPLSHTLVRTEFTYPKTGPTPEQVKLISSREAFQRFGVPYGADAIAYAASSSRVELPNVPPPGFDEVTGSEPGRDVADVAEGTSTPEASGSRQETHNAEPPTETTPAEVSGDVDTLVNASASQSATQPSDVDDHAPPAIPPGLEPQGSSQPQSTTTLSVPNDKSAAPPTSFPARPESRASSLTSFATAEESIHRATPSPSPSPSPYTSVSSRFAIPKVTVSTSVDEEPQLDEELGVATPHPTSTATTPRIRQKSLHTLDESSGTIVADSAPSTPIATTPVVGLAR
ncbi:hypothetical protein BDW22DRAFT_1431062 [Trametopsis cervina]|nr:hypothetical protein BDW22DRAFT_1431062 [Trametopsis cervina]